MSEGQQGAGIQQGLASTGQIQGATGLEQAHTAATQAQTRGQLLQNEQSRQALQNGDIFTDGSGNTMVKMPNGQNLLWGDWAAGGFKPTAHQVNTAVGTAVPGKGNPTPDQTQPSGQKYSYLGPAGQSAIGPDLQNIRTAPNNPTTLGKLKQSQDTDNLMQQQYTAAVRQGATLNQMTSQIASLPPSGALAGGPLMGLKRAVISRYNDVVNAAGHPESMVDPGEVGTSLAADKLHGVMAFGQAHGMDQNSLGGLMQANETNPSSSLPRDAAMKILSGLYVDKQRDIDAYNYLQEYKHEVQQRAPGTPNWYYSQDAMNAFNKDHDATQYGTEKQAIESVLSANPTSKGSTPFNAFYHRQLNPDQVKALEAKYGTGVFTRYFGNQ